MPNGVNFVIILVYGFLIWHDNIFIRGVALLDETGKNYEFASLEKRWLSWVFDGMFLFGTVILLISALAIFAKMLGIIHNQFFAGGGVSVFITVFYIVLIVAYFVIMPVKYGQTLGKMAVGTMLITVDGEKFTYLASFLRFIGYWINNITIVGWLSMVFNEKHRGFHDFIAGTIVINCEGKPQTKNFIVKLVLIAFAAAIIAVFITGGIKVEHQHLR